MKDIHKIHKNIFLKIILIKKETDVNTIYSHCYCTLLRFVKDFSTMFIKVP